MAEKNNNINGINKNESGFKKHLFYIVAAVCLLVLGIIVGVIIGNSSDKNNEKTSSNRTSSNSGKLSETVIEDTKTPVSNDAQKDEKDDSAVDMSEKSNEDTNEKENGTVEDKEISDKSEDDAEKQEPGDGENPVYDSDEDGTDAGKHKNDDGKDMSNTDTAKEKDKDADRDKSKNQDNDKKTPETVDDSKNEDKGSDDKKQEDKKEDRNNSKTDDKQDNGNIDNKDDDVIDDNKKEDNKDDNKKEDNKEDNKKDDNKKDDPGEKGDYVLTYAIDNTWQDKDVNMYGMQIAITNNTEININGWKLVLNISELSTVNGWNGDFSTKGNTLSVNDAGYNADIYAGGTVVIGCNLGTKSSKVSITSATLNGKKMTIAAGKVDQNDPGLKNGDNNGNNDNKKNDNNGGSAEDKNKEGKDIIDDIKQNNTGKKGDDWLHTDGKNILDKDGKKVWITGLNWFGYNTGTNTFDGLWNSQLVPTVKAIADHGFNLIRVPISAELINQWSRGEYPKANYNNAYNSELNSMNSLEIFDYFLALCEKYGIKVMPDIHSAETNASGHNVNLWYTDKVKTEDFYHALEWMAARYSENDTIIAFDLKNEPHGKPFEGDNAAIWNDSKKANNWKYVAETAAARVLKKNPNVLIMIEGIEIYPVDIKKNSGFTSTNEKDYYFNWWGGNLRGVADYPINLGKYQNKLVYSPHDYGPTVYEQPWFKGKYTYDSLMKDCWHDNWFYIYEKNIAPLLIGEWGGFMKEPNLTWMTYMRKLIKTYHLNHTFWCLNANSGDTGGLLLDDFTTWDTTKYNFVKEVLWQENGKFVGLDHEVALGANGITLKQAKGL